MDEPTAEEIWAERDRRVDDLNTRTEFHNDGEHAFCREDCDVAWYGTA